MKLKFIIIVLFIASVFKSVAGQKDTIETFIKSWTLSEDLISRNFIQVDTFANNFHMYQSSFQNGFVNHYFGNIGLANKSAFFHDNTGKIVTSGLITPSPFTLNAHNLKFHEPYYYHFITPENLRFYHSNKPYSNLRYTSGSKKRHEQNLRIVHSQNITPKLSIAAYGHALRSDGEYDSQIAKHGSYALSSHYNGRKYSFTGAFIRNKLNNEQSGGYVYDPESSTAEDFLPAKLNAANTAVGKNTAFMVHTFVLGRRYSIKRDTIIKTYKIVRTDTLQHDSASVNMVLPLDSTQNIQLNDSISVSDTLFTDSTQYFLPRVFTGPDSLLVDSGITIKYEPFAKLSYIFRYDRNYHTYADDQPASGFYNQIHYDSTSTYDSTFLKTYSNSIQMQFGIKNLYTIRLTNENTSYYNLRSYLHTDNKNTLQGNKIFGQWTNDQDKNLYLQGNASIYFSGYRAGEFSGSAMAIKKLHLFRDSLSAIQFGAKVRSQKTDPFINEYYSNHFRWSDEFKNERRIQLQSQFLLPKYDFSTNINISSITNYIYFDTLAMPRQKTGADIYVISGELEKRFNLGLFHSYNKLVYQKTTDEKLISLPEFSIISSNYIDAFLFNVLTFQIGADVIFYSKYYTYDFMPATSTFYLQHNKTYGNIPFVTGFINMKLKKVLMFFRFEQLNKLTNNEHMFMANDYPLSSFAVKFGVSWRFFD